MWGIPEAELRLLPHDMTGMDAIELGCGTGYVSAWMARRDARVVAIDISGRAARDRPPTGRRTPHRCEAVHGNAETVPYPDGAFDFAISEYGAATWCDPYVWIPEAHRILRPGGGLVFLSNSVLSALCSPPDGSIPITDSLEVDYFAIYGDDWRNAVDDPGGIEFNLPISELGAPVPRHRSSRSSTSWNFRRPTRSQINFTVTADWAHRWPSEQVWRLRKR